MLGAGQRQNIFDPNHHNIKVQSSEMELKTPVFNSEMGKKAQLNQVGRSEESQSAFSKAESKVKGFANHVDA